MRKQEDWSNKGCQNYKERLIGSQGKNSLLLGDRNLEIAGPPQHSQAIRSFLG